MAGIYTQCRSTCPRTIAKMRSIEGDLFRQGRSAQFLLVTLDPTVDTPEALSRFKANASLPSSWRLLTGTMKETEELGEVLDIHVLDDGPHFMHDGKIVVFDGHGMPVRRFGGWALDEEAAR